MRGPPDPEMRSPAAANGRASRRRKFKEPEEITEGTAEIQARSLRHQFAVGVSLAVSLAPLIWGLPR
jgi:hypothetical protein